MKNRTIKYILVSTLLLLSNGFLSAQDAAAQAQDPFFFDRFLLITLLIVAGVVVISAIIALTSLINTMVKVQQIKIYQEQGLEAYLEEVKKPKSASNWWQNIYKRWTNVVPVEKEKDILFDHSYDGIRELDNSLPPWWTALFGITIVFSLIYMVYYHFAGVGPSSAEEYTIEIAQAEEALKAYQAKQANVIDEENLTALTDEQSISLGKTIWDANCVACHGANGEGGVGPNMTDEYWIHGGSIKNVFQTIKNGVPEKGMIAWKTQLRPADMHRVASFIMTLQGTNPPNPKAPEGEKFDPKAVQSDTTANQTLGLK